MNNVAVLIAAIAGLIGSITSFVGMIVVVRRSSPRERRDAAEAVAEKVLMPQNPAIDLANTVVELDTERGDDDGPVNQKSHKRRGRRRAR